jgi:hypothetical protein
MKTVVFVACAVAVTAMTTVAVTRRSTATADRREPPPATIQDLMEGLVDPSAKVVFGSVGVVSNAAGTVERAPSTDEEWAAVERHALLLAEAATLLMLDGRDVERDGGESADPDAASPELPPDQIKARIAADPAAWRRHAGELQIAAMQAYRAAAARSVERLYEVGSELDIACENCHRAYWYNAPPGVTIRR